MLRVSLLISVAAAALLPGCAGKPVVPADAVAVFDGGWVSRDELAAATDLARSGSLGLPGAGDTTADELARWIAWEKLVAASRQSEVVGRRDFALRARELECQQLVAPLLAQLAGSVEVTNEEVAAELEQARAVAAAGGPRLELRHIFLRASDDVPEPDRQRKLELAQRLLGELRSGASFEALARQHSESATAPNGGLIAGLRPGMADPAFERVVFAMAEGETSGVIETASGYHIVRLEKRTAPNPFNEDARRAQLPDQIRGRKAAQVRADLIARLKEIEPHEARWTAAGIVDPRERDGAILVVGDFVFTAEDLREARARAGASLQRTDQIRAYLDGLLERELLATEALRRFQPDRSELAAQRERASDAALAELARRDEEAALAAAAPRAELERFATEQPAQLEVTATYRPQVIFLPDGKNVWETFREAERMVAELRGGADFAAVARERSAGPNADLGGDLGLLTTNQMLAYDLEIVQTVVKLEVGHVSDPVRVPDNKLSTQPGAMSGGFLIVGLVERREPHTLDLASDEAEIRKRYWASHRAEGLRQARDARLLESEFQLLEPPAAPAAATAAVTAAPVPQP